MSSIVEVINAHHGSMHQMAQRIIILEEKLKESKGQYYLWYKQADKIADDFLGKDKKMPRLAGKVLALVQMLKIK